MSITHKRFGFSKSGDDHDRVKITDANIQSVKILRLLLNYSYGEIAGLFNISSHYVADICAGRVRR